MSLMRSLTTRRKPEVEALKPVQIGRAASQRGGRPVMRSQISPPLALVSTTNMLSFEAPDIAGTTPILNTSPASATSSTSATSSSSEESDSSASIHSRDTDPTDLSSADASPVSPKLPHWDTKPVLTRSRSSSLVRPSVPQLSLSVAPLATHSEESPATALNPTGLKTARALTPATAVSPSLAAMVFSPSVIGISPNGLTPVSAIRTPVSAVRSTESSSPDSPILPRRAPSHSKRAHEALSRKRSVQRARSPSAQRVRSADLMNSASPAYADSPDSIFSPALEQVREEGTKTKYADAAMDLHIIKTRGLAHFAASDYLDEINPLVNVFLDDNAPVGPDFSGWF